MDDETEFFARGSELLRRFRCLCENGEMDTHGMDAVAFQLDMMLRFAWDIWNKTNATLFGVSLRTVVGRCKEFGLTERFSTARNTVTDEALDLLVAEAVNNFPGIGYRMTTAFLRTRNVLIQRKRVRESLQRVNPYGVPCRWFRFAPRRTYNVPGPNALWHMDGNHKLIRWGFITHGLIDGFSRMVLSMLCATNNRQEAVLRGFLNAVDVYGVPSRVRADRGGENLATGNWIIATMGEARGSFIQGPSVHIQRIERFWKDLGQFVIKLFRSIFYEMENNGILDIANPLHMLILQHVFLPRLQRNTDVYVASWNVHKIRTERSRTPKQIWIEAACLGGVYGRPPNNITLNLDQHDDVIFHQENELYGIDQENPAMQEENTRTVNPYAEMYPDASLILEQNLDPLEEDDNYGVAIFCRGKTLLGL